MRIVKTTGKFGDPDLDRFADRIVLAQAQLATIALLGQTISDPPTQSEVQDISDKIDELLTAFR